MIRLNSCRYILNCGLTLAMFGLLDAGHAATFKVVYAFGAESDGAVPYAGLISDKHGDLYGVTSAGGANGDGAVFKLAPGGTEAVLYSFCSKTNCADGAVPYAALTMDSAGNLYGTTVEGGGSNNCRGGCGTVFELAPDGTETARHAFTNRKGDGDAPYGGVVADGSGNLYGTTIYGGGSGCNGFGCGTVFEVAAGGGETILHSFTGYPDDGYWPHSSLIADKEGNLYGTTLYGGSGGGSHCKDYGCGTVFELASNGTETVLHSFKGGADGEAPYASLIMDARGALYGTTSIGGDVNCGEHGGCGTVFELAPNGHKALLHAFQGESDGFFPAAGLVSDKAGNLYGTTVYGGSNGCAGDQGCGTVFKVTSNGTETVLHVFSGKPQGRYPFAGLIADKAGDLHGTTWGGGSKCIRHDHSGCGTVFKIKE